MPPSTRRADERATTALGFRRALAKPNDLGADGVKAVSRRRRWRAAPALRPADHRSTSNTVAPRPVDPLRTFRSCRVRSLRSAPASLAEVAELERSELVQNRPGSPAEVRHANH